MGLVSVQWNHGATLAQARGGKCVLGWVWWRATRCNMGHGVVGALGSQAQHVQSICWESSGTAGLFLGRHVVFWYEPPRLVKDDGGLCWFGFIWGQ